MPPECKTLQTVDKGIIDRILSLESDADRQRIAYDELKRELSANNLNGPFTELDHLHGSKSIFMKQGEESPLLIKIGYDQRSLTEIVENRNAYAFYIDAVAELTRNDPFRIIKDIIPKRLLFNTFFLGMTYGDGNIEQILNLSSEEDRGRVDLIGATFYDWMTSETGPMGTLHSPERSAQNFIYEMLEKIRHCIDRIPAQGLAQEIKDKLDSTVKDLVTISDYCGIKVPVILGGRDANPRNFIYRKNPNEPVHGYDIFQVDLQGTHTMMPFAIGFMEELFRIHELPEKNYSKLIAKLKSQYVGIFENNSWTELPINEAWSPKNAGDKYCEPYKIYQLGKSVAIAIDIKRKSDCVDASLRHSQ